MLQLSCYWGQLFWCDHSYIYNYYDICSAFFTLIVCPHLHSPYFSAFLFFISFPISPVFLPYLPSFRPPYLPSFLSTFHPSLFLNFLFKFLIFICSCLFRFLPWVVRSRKPGTSRTVEEFKESKGLPIFYLWSLSHSLSFSLFFLLLCDMLLTLFMAQR